MTRPRAFGEPCWGVDDTIYLPVGTAQGSTDAPPADPPALWLPRRGGGYALTELAAPPRPLGFTTRPREGAR